MQGCTGGLFLRRDISALHEWVDWEGPYILVNFERRPFNTELLPTQWDDKYDPYISRRERSREEWWTWNDYLPAATVSRPPWWNSTTKDDAKVCLSFAMFNSTLP